MMLKSITDLVRLRESDLRHLIIQLVDNTRDHDVRIAAMEKIKLICANIDVHTMNNYCEICGHNFNETDAVVFVPYSARTMCIDCYHRDYAVCEICSASVYKDKYDIHTDHEGNIICDDCNRFLNDGL